MKLKDMLLAAGVILVVIAVTATVVVVLRYERRQHPDRVASRTNLQQCLQNLGNGGC